MQCSYPSELVQNYLHKMSAVGVTAVGVTAVTVTVTEIILNYKR